MKILQLGKFYPVGGGVEKVMVLLAGGLAEQGIHCDMLCAGARAGLKWKKVQIGCGCGIFIAPSLFKAAGTMIAPGMIAWLRRHGKEYDVIHIHHPDPMAALALRLSAFKGRVILHWHSDILSQKFFLAFYGPLQEWLIRRADTIAGTTPVYVQQSPYLAKVQEKCTSIPIGIDALQPEQTKIEAIRKLFPGKKLILSVGRLVPYKGYPHLVEAMALLPGEYMLAIVGTGPLRADLEALIHERRLEDRVMMAGYIKDEELPGWFGACDCFALSSVMKTEAFGIVQIEAMSCGKPVMATRIPQSGVSWVNEDGVSGINVSPGRPEEYADAIRRLVENKEEYGRRARERFESVFTKDNMIKKTIQLYENS